MLKGFDNLLTVLFASVVLAGIGAICIPENWPSGITGKISGAKGRIDVHFLGRRFFRAIFSAWKNKNP